jgi:ElaB/YqjD/DUF883 family membrane-anchored ribosome-binding protein
VQAAKEQVRLAREALRQAEEQYVQALDQAPAPLERISELSFGEVIDNVLEWVKKYPAAGVATAAAAGFFLGRLLRRIW